MEALAFRHVEFTYPNTDKKALDDVSFAVRPSEFIVICGKSGCGKSTLLRHMKKNMMPYGDRQGEILYEGHDLAELDNRVSAAEIGFVQQNPENQIVTDKVWHELSFGLESLGISNQEIRRRVAEMASFFGIQSWFRRDVYELSGGQKQLLNLASIMAMQPKVLVLDEPTSQLDPIAATEFLETLAKINRELGTTIILSEHRLEEVFPMADRVMVMEEGNTSVSSSGVRRVSRGTSTMPPPAPNSPATAPAARPESAMPSQLFFFIANTTPWKFFHGVRFYAASGECALERRKNANL